MTFFSFNLLSNLMFLLLSFGFIFFFFLSIFIYFFNYCYFFNWEFTCMFSLKMSFPIYLDFMSSLFMSLVLFISSLIILYSKVYMENDKMNTRFMMILILFVFSMMFFILSPNLISMMLGWDGLGLVSYCLVIHYQNFKSNSAGMLTALSNRIGDSFLIISICYMMNFYSWNYLNLIDNLNSELVFFVVFLSMTKSAQIPFSSWLPAAMAAPTPVSSLVHSSTLVTAGIFVLIRFNKFLMQYKFCWLFLLLMSLLTLCMAGISANLEMDFKKIIALSTLSQLGMMMSSLSIGLKEISFFHLIMHALFKAMMFMCSGNFIHMNLGLQDLRFYGKSMFISPFSFTMFSLANLSLCGVPFLCGFYSKDLILEMVISNTINIFPFFMFMLGTSLTVLYTYRVLSFSMKFKFNFVSNFIFFDTNYLMNFSKFPLFIMSTIGGFFFSDYFLLPMNMIILPYKLKILIILICLISLIMSFFLIQLLKQMNFLNKIFHFLEFMNSMMFLVFLSKKMTSKTGLSIGLSLNKTYSNGWIEFFMGHKSLNFIFYSVFFLYKKSLIFMTQFLIMFLFLNMMIYILLS